MPTQRGRGLPAVLPWMTSTDTPTLGLTLLIPVLASSFLVEKNHLTGRLLNVTWLWVAVKMPPSVFVLTHRATALFQTNTHTNLALAHVV